MLMLGCRACKRGVLNGSGFWPTGGLAVPFVEMGIIEGAIVWGGGLEA